MPLQSELTVTFSPRLVDLWRARLHLLVRHRPKALACQILLPVSVGILIAAAYTTAAWGYYAIPVALLLLAWLSYLTRSYLGLRKSEAVTESRTMTFSSNGISYRTSLAEGRYEWRVFRHLYPRPRGYMIAKVLRSYGFRRMLSPRLRMMKPLCS